MEDYQTPVWSVTIVQCIALVKTKLMNWLNPNYGIMGSCKGG